MKSNLKTKYEARAKIIKAMAHPSRLLIIEELSKRECCVTELTEMIGADTSTVSKHLSVLKNAGLVTDEKGQIPFSTVCVVPASWILSAVWRMSYPPTLKSTQKIIKRCKTWESVHKIT